MVQVHLTSHLITGASSFNQIFDSWNTSAVIDMGFMFSNTSYFNQPLENWDVSKVLSMVSMFGKAISFDQDLSSWNITSVKAMDDMFLEVNLSLEHYDNLLISWSSLPLQQNVSFNGGISKYTSNSSSSRDFIINNYNWNIVDGGLANDVSLVTDVSVASKISSSSISQPANNNLIDLESMAISLLSILGIVSASILVFEFRKFTQINKRIGINNNQSFFAHLFKRTKKPEKGEIRETDQFLATVEEIIKENKKDLKDDN